MDAGVIRGLGTLLLFACFVGLCLWAWSPRQKGRFAEAARLALDDEAQEGRS
jgi:cytochrome c oxidase cbb3-type subunit 4